MSDQTSDALAAVPLRVMVVDDHPMWRDAVARDLEESGLQVVATAGDGEQAVRRALATRPDVMVLDLNLPLLDGAGVIARLVEAGLVTKVLVLSSSGEQGDVLAAVKAGATGYLVKSASRDELLAAVASTGAGRAVFTPGLAGLVLGEYRRLASSTSAGSSGPGSEAGRPVPTDADGNRVPQVPQLTERETEILRLVAKGRGSRQIAELLVISHRTVQNHVQNTLTKLQLHNRVELTRYAIEQGLDQGDNSGA
jgi:DNA-binding NarL/FixJ family response regulator